MCLGCVSALCLLYDVFFTRSACLLSLVKLRLCLYQIFYILNNDGSVLRRFVKHYKTTVSREMNGYFSGLSYSEPGQDLNGF